MNDELMVSQKAFEELVNANATPKDVVAAGFGKIGQEAMEQGDTGLAFRAFRFFEDRNNMRLLAEEYLAKGWVADAIGAYRFLCDRTMLRKCSKLAIIVGDMFALEHAIPEKSDKKIIRLFKDFWQKRGFSYAIAFPRHHAISAAYNLYQKYDVGVGVARGGLFSAFVFQTFGLPVILADAHRRGRGATFEWLDNPDAIRNSKVIVFDKDFVTGRTLRRTAKEIMEYGPKQVDVFFNHEFSQRTNIARLGGYFQEILTPKSVRYDNFWTGLVSFEKKLRRSR